jgi:hypothetical protein
MKLYRIVKGVSEIVDYDNAVAEKMLKLNPDRYKKFEENKIEKLDPIENIPEIKIDEYEPVKVNKRGKYNG